MNRVPGYKVKLVLIIGLDGSGCMVALENGDGTKSATMRYAPIVIGN